MSLDRSPSRPTVVYALEPALEAAAFARLLDDSGLGRIRPTDDLERLRTMLAAANLVVTARLGAADGALVGAARGLTDHAWCCYLPDLAVARAAQGLHIGRGLLDEARRVLGPDVALILSSVPEAAGFYERVGMERIAEAFWYRRQR